MLPRLRNWKRFFFVLLCVLLVLFVYESNRTVTMLQGEGNRPFGVFSSAKGSYVVQDFSYNLLYFRSIGEHIVSRPYRLQDQEKISRQMVPASTSGMSHAYSPVAFVLAQPLLWFSGHAAYFIYIFLGAAGILLLFYFDLLPRVESTLQLCALTGCVLSFWLVGSFIVGQSTLITTSLLGAFWALLRQRSASPNLGKDVLLALLFWALCLKPSIAVVPFLLLLGGQAWRALAIGVAFLLLTWTLTAKYYGGWWTGLEDYLFLLNHYNDQEMTPFMQRNFETLDGKGSYGFHLPLAQWFKLDRDLLLMVNLALVLLKWMHRITFSEQFQGTVWAFLLLSPYLLATENWIICLLVVEGPFFHSRTLLVNGFKLLLVLAIMNLRAGVTFPSGIGEIDWPLKCVLFAWIMIELFRTRKKLSANDEITQHSTASA